MSKHTPGPWGFSTWHDRYDDGEERAMGWNFTCANGHLLPLCSNTAGDLNEAEANARLIAAAPDLLAFAQEFLGDYQSQDGMDSMKRYAAKAYAAIKKATGETE